MRKLGKKQAENRNVGLQVMRRSDGFSLVEVVIASMLMGMILLAAFPLMTTGRNVIVRKQKKMEAETLGDGVFAGISKELQNAGEIYFGTEEEIRNRYGNAAEDGWECVNVDLGKYGYDVEIVVEPTREEWITLSVNIMENETVYYEREEMILLPNAGLYEENYLDTKDGPWKLDRRADESEPENQIWYRVLHP